MTDEQIIQQARERRGDAIEDLRANMAAAIDLICCQQRIIEGLRADNEGLRAANDNLRDEWLRNVCR